MEAELKAGQTYYLKLSSMESGKGYLIVTGGALQAGDTAVVPPTTQPTTPPVTTPAPAPILSTTVGVAGYTLDDKTMEMPACYYKGSDTMMPVRMLQEFGVSFTWDDATQTATMTLGDTSVKLTIGSTDAYINGVKTLIFGASGALVAPESASGRTMIPLRFVSQKLGFKVQWDPSNLITISK